MADHLTESMWRLLLTVGESGVNAQMARRLWNRIPEMTRLLAEAYRYADFAADRFAHPHNEDPKRLAEDIKRLLEPLGVKIDGFTSPDRALAPTVVDPCRNWPEIALHDGGTRLAPSNPRRSRRRPDREDSALRSLRASPPD